MSLTAKKLHSLIISENLIKARKEAEENTSVNGVTIIAKNIMFNKYPLDN
jgi:hypothetical protein